MRLREAGMQIQDLIRDEGVAGSNPVNPTRTPRSGTCSLVWELPFLALASLSLV
jgi:hypothetical protein